MASIARMSPALSTVSSHRDGEAGTAALDIFSEWKAVYIDYSGKLQKAQIDTHREA